MPLQSHTHGAEKIKEDFTEQIRSQKLAARDRSCPTDRASIVPRVVV